jgi:hypothetical protein
MSGANSGKRYERLLFASAPLAFVAIFILVVAVASGNPRENELAACHEAFASELSSRAAVLNYSWKVSQPPTKSEYWGAEYRYLVTLALLETKPQRCYSILQHEIESKYRMPPDRAITYFREQARQITTQPLSFQGVAIPEQATIDLLGNKLKISVVVLARIAQLVLAPILLLWLGSLYNTRQRESISINNAASIENVFPHIINVYMVGKLPENRKRSWASLYFPSFSFYVYALIRISLLLIFVAPTVVAYLYGLYLLRLDEFENLFIGISVLVAIFTISTISVEFFPWNLRKKFNSPSFRQ